MSAVTSGPIMVEARKLARAAALLLIEKPGQGRTMYHVYRPLPDGRKTFLGKRGTPAALHAYLHRLAAAHQEPR